MKGIECCGQCADYSYKLHKCTRGFSQGVASDSFYTDCDLPEVEPVVRGHWIRGENKGFPEKPSMIWYCSVCGERIRYNDTSRKYQKIKKKVNEVNPRCRRCGARMDIKEGDSNDQP